MAPKTGLFRGVERRQLYSCLLSRCKSSTVHARLTQPPFRPFMFRTTRRRHGRCARQTHRGGCMDTDTARNMACHRAARSVWEKRGWSGVTIEERVGPWMVSLVGAALMVAGARRRSWRGVHLMLGGAGLIGGAAAGF